MMAEKRYELLRWAADCLHRHCRDENIGEILLQARLGCTRTELIAGLRAPVAAADAAWVRDQVIDHVLHGTPVQYMIGSAPFYGRHFTVTPDVLIPRQETEELVWRAGVWAQRYLPGRGQLSACDIGTGSGAIAITLALEHPQWRVTAVDLSARALSVARKNAAALGARVDFRQGDLLQPVQGERFDMLVSNPPYITEREMDRLGDTVRDFEPHLALFGGADGLDFYRRIIAGMSSLRGSAPFFVAAFEIGAGQGAAVSAFIRDRFSHRIEALSVEKDVAGQERNVMVALKNDSV